MNQAFPRLQTYPFEKLAALRAGIEPPAGRTLIDLTIGEPKHPTPQLITAALAANLAATARYPTTAGGMDLRASVAAWLTRRYRLPPALVDPARHVIPVNGTREALFAVAQLLIDRTRERPVVVMPNPCYQVYEGAALLAGAEPWYVDCTAATAYLPDYDSVPESVWARCQLVYACSPGNPTGSVLGAGALARLLERAERHGFVIAADECYAEIYLDERAPPPGLLEVAAAAGNDGFRHCLVFHSLSKRSNAPGLRSGFVAGEARLVQDFLRYRTYHGCAMPLYVQAASIAAWNDEEHVRANRAIYRRKFDAVVGILAPVLGVSRPAAGFYLWAAIAADDQDFARELYAHEAVAVLPGSYLGRAAHGSNPGARHLRMALVAGEEQCIEAAERIRHHLGSR
ncbi:MAG: succinyldiaminopimelate transaminase [Gammaproteobacteria bacterium]|nr:succinyldiaminopimelate transaminase [Gammaproteobacteria bacterium]